MNKSRFEGLKTGVLNIYFLLRFPLLLFLRFCIPVSGRKTNKISNILIIRLDRVGDLITSLPVIDNLKLANPEAKIHLLIKPYAKELAELIKSVDAVLEYRGMFATALQLRRNEYDLVIDMLYDYKVKPALLALLSGAPLRVGFAWGFREKLLTHAVGREMTKGKNIVSVNLELLKSIAVPAKIKIPRLGLPQGTIPDKIVIAIHAGGYYPSQQMEKDKFVEIVRRLLEKYNATIYIVGGLQDRQTVSFIESQLQDSRIKTAMPGLGDLVRLFRGCDLLICNNSGPLHIAAALGIPTVSTMGPTDPVLWWPTGENNIVIRKELDCSPCSKSACKSHKCMRLITVEEVIDAGEVLLNKTGKV
jgi:heptosyltransferase-2